MASKSRYWQPEYSSLSGEKTTIGARLREMEYRASLRCSVGWSTYPHRTKRLLSLRDLEPIGSIPVMLPGDLVTYNAGGMKNKTLGLVLEVKMGDPRGELLTAARETINAQVTIQWAVVGSMMPRRIRAWGSEPITSGDIVDHQIGTWFEVVPP